MNILQGVSLKLHSTMRLGGTADYCVTVTSKDELAKAELWAEEKQVPIRIIGMGSNIVWRDEGFKGLLVVNRIKGFKRVEDDLNSSVYEIGAGEQWDKVVERLVAKNLRGVEGLSLIPGTVGATPVQNVGAYGQDISQVLVSLEAYDRMEKDFVTLTNEQCAFGYRSSRFKTVDNGRFLICSVSLRLEKSVPTPPFYDSLQRYFDTEAITDFSLHSIREAVIAIRTSKLPDPAKVANNGSFFANPIIPAKHYKKLHRKYKDITAWELADGSYKIAAGWLVEKAGFKGKRDHETGMSIWPKQALVLVNEKARSTHDLLRFQQKITDAVYQLFEINLEQEPELLPS